MEHFMEVHYRVQKYPPLVPILSQLDPIHIPPTSHSLKIYLNIIPPSTYVTNNSSEKKSLDLLLPLHVQVFVKFGLLRNRTLKLYYFIWQVAITLESDLREGKEYGASSYISP
jgi:hypothetical protein